MKRVLMVSYFAPPTLNAEAILVWKTLRVLSQLHRITLVTNAPQCKQGDPDMRIPPGVDVRAHGGVTFRSAFANKVAERLTGKLDDENLLWALRVPQVKKGDFDVLYSRSHPGASHILAASLWKRTQLPWIAQFSDPWSANPYHSHHTIIRKLRDQEHERFVIAHADQLIFPTVEIQEIYEKAYPLQAINARSVVLPHHVSEELYSVRNASVPTEAGKMLLSYFGDFYGLRSPAPLFDALRHIHARNPDKLARVEIGLFGNLEKKFVPLLEQVPVRIHRGRYTYLESLSAMRKSHGLLLIDAPNDTGVNPFLASKLIDYIGAKRPILGVTEERGTAANFLRQGGQYVAAPRAVDKIAYGLEQLIDSAKVTARMERLAAAFTSERIVGELAQWLDKQ
ncbi:hypothetical protein [Ferroacidibacillus organovorans]|uniref:Glycosyltransferase subfamily 4-like N-terminal domain-containing protein n=1 Tax=Ferroacidibacillus organovorans TaxID=1765683 RepID=A0A853KDS4_9BACL|nr:hypothetical protein [Ferroacidibacillus organovorans]KYP81606.1 hypothetical protein AYJ22_06630 [Ferroacidibacillus organovorans]OAG94953.1 hypothetical protein AYW79_02910 [Ferroacidibacillus organovorans]